MSKPDLRDREDIQLLVNRFYEKVRANEEIGHFFNNSILDWEEHLEKLTDFWESNLLFVSKYSGNPKRAHIDVDSRSGNKINEKHFGTWLNLWIDTLDELFEGELTERAKHNARKMATHLHISIFQARTS
ncbi:group III truncated hemoglobin [Salegentibacter chungangensis]|uniref:Group III truncated hemoglobin n=1 Tax=Salegentibacter chungangensis TaxID=1335724 RepID=A0ABW3NPN5_9FLAO